MKTFGYICVFLLFPVFCFAQGDASICKAWCPSTISGAVKLGGQYRYEEGVTNGIYNYQKSPMLYGGVLLNTRSYVYHPNFLLLDISAEYNPETRQDDYLVVPDRSEVRTVKRLNVNTTFFENKEVVVGAFANLNESYTNRENLSNLKVNSNNWGTNLNYANRILPVAVSYQQSIVKEKEIQTSRMFNTRQSNFLTRTYKSFTSRDNNELRYSHNTFARKDYSLIETKNTSDIISLNNVIYFDPKRNYNFNSNIALTRQYGNDTYNSLQSYQNFSAKLKDNLNFGTSYTYYNIKRDIQSLNQHNLNLILRHRLFESLYTDVSYEYGRVKQTAYQENTNKATIDLKYEKDIPLGHLTLGYSISRLNLKRNSASVDFTVFNEAHLLRDGQIEILEYPYIFPGSVVVKDVTGTIIYQESFDYILNDRNNFIEIQRVPGGQIANNSTVYVDYVANQPGSFKYDSYFQNFMASLTLFGRSVEIYYRWRNQDYSNLQQSEFQSLNYFTQNILGARFEYKFASAGVEHDSYESNIIPYRLYRFYFQLQGNFKNRVLFSLNSNLRNYEMLDDQENQTYADVSGNVVYQFAPQTKLKFEVGYRKQMGSGIDLDLLTFRSEFTAHYRQLDFVAGIEVYRRFYLNEKVNFIGGNFEVIRKFNWNKRHKPPEKEGNGF